MKMKFLYLTLLLAALTSVTDAQEAITPRTSPLASIHMKYKDAYVRIIYSQPHKRGRIVFGTLVPYDQIWRLGANEATELTLTRDMMINNQLVKAGTYSMFAIPEKDKWTMVINSETGLWGSYNYNQKLDVLRFEVPVKTLNNVVFEAFTMEFVQKNDLADLLIQWDNVQVSIPVKFLN